MSLKIVENFIEKGHPNRPGIKLKEVRARIWHGTANFNPGATDEMHRKYMGREYKKVWNKDKKKFDYFETNGKSFVFGGAHVYIDKDSATIMCPLNEVVWGCGDRQMPYGKTEGIEGYKGQRKLAYDLFNNQQNYYTINIELCMNDMKNWDKVLDNAIEFAKLYFKKYNVNDYRHYDLTNKCCPSPFVDLTIKETDPDWLKFKDRIKEALK
jgi:N-acetylmuramoyl-L-alanine amidase CwlA